MYIYLPPFHLPDFWDTVIIIVILLIALPRRGR